MTLDDRTDYVREQMHQEFVRDDFLDRLAEHAGIDEGDQATREQFAAFDAARRAEHERRYDQAQRGDDNELER